MKIYFSDGKLENIPLPSPNLHESSNSLMYPLGVCTPALFYYQYDFSKELVEWMEIMKALGVFKIFMYKTTVHPNIEKVLTYYEKIGFATVTTFSYPSTYVDHPSLKR